MALWAGDAELAQVMAELRSSDVRARSAPGKEEGRGGVGGVGVEPADQVAGQQGCQRLQHGCAVGPEKQDHLLVGLGDGTQGEGCHAAEGLDEGTWIPHFAGPSWASSGTIHHLSARVR